jgi:hypothetical protein
MRPNSEVKNPIDRQPEEVRQMLRDAAAKIHKEGPTDPEQAAQEVMARAKERVQHIPRLTPPAESAPKPPAPKTTGSSKI